MHFALGCHLLALAVRTRRYAQELEESRAREEVLRDRLRTKPSQGPPPGPPVRGEPWTEREVQTSWRVAAGTHPCLYTFFSFFNAQV